MVRAGHVTQRALARSFIPPSALSDLGNVYDISHVCARPGRRRRGGRTYRMRDETERTDGRAAPWRSYDFVQGVRVSGEGERKGKERLLESCSAQTTTRLCHVFSTFELRKSKS